MDKTIELGSKCEVGGKIIADLEGTNQNSPLSAYFLFPESLTPSSSVTYSNPDSTSLLAASMILAALHLYSSMLS